MVEDIIDSKDWLDGESGAPLSEVAIQKKLERIERKMQMDLEEKERKAKAILRARLEKEKLVTQA